MGAGMIYFGYRRRRGLWSTNTLTTHKDQFTNPSIAISIHSDLAAHKLDSTDQSYGVMHLAGGVYLLPEMWLDYQLYQRYCSYL